MEETALTTSELKSNLAKKKRMYTSSQREEIATFFKRTEDEILSYFVACPPENLELVLHLGKSRKNQYYLQLNNSADKIPIPTSLSKKMMYWCLRYRDIREFIPPNILYDDAFDVNFSFSHHNAKITLSPELFII